MDFCLIILGENFQVHPKEFIEARDRLGNRINRFGFVENVEEYARYLAASDIVISTAIQENFGFSVVEAMYCCTLPLLPKRLSYPEILPEKFHDQFLYDDELELARKLRKLLQHYRDMDEVRKELAASVARFRWSERIEEFDHLFEESAQRKGTHH